MCVTSDDTVQCVCDIVGTISDPDLTLVSPRVCTVSFGALCCHHCCVVNIVVLSPCICVCVVHIVVLC